MPYTKEQFYMIDMPHMCYNRGTIKSAPAAVVMPWSVTHQRKEVDMSGKSTIPLAVRFWSKVDKSGGCWIWTASLDRGYGQFGYGTPCRPRRAHRVAWELTNGPIPDGLFLCHHCDNRACVRPDHCFVGTHTENMQDMYAKGRGPTGERQGKAKLTNNDVQAIRTRYAAGGVTMRELADEYGVTPSTIDSAIKRRTWKGGG